MRTESRSGRIVETVVSASRVTKYCRGSVEANTCLVFVVVRISDCSERDDGRYEATLSVKSVMLEDEGSVKETVDGKDKPGKDERRTLTFDDILDMIEKRAWPRLSKVFAS